MIDNGTAAECRLEGRSVLVAEDQFLVAEEMAAAIEQLGGHVLGPVSSVADALREAARRRPDLAMLDVDLNGERSYPVAAALVAAGVPFAFTSGFDASMVEPDFRDVPYLEKPIRLARLARVLHELSRAT